MRAQDFRAYAISAVDIAAKRRRAVGLVTLVLWILATVSAFIAFQARSTPLNLLVLVLLLALFVAVHLQATVMAVSASVNARRMLAFIYSARYLSEVKGIPARETFLAELEREMRMSRDGGPTCTLVVTRFVALERIREMYGERFAHKAVEQLGARLKRVTRGGDLLAYVGDGAFATLLLDCTQDESQQFLRRIPSDLPVDSPKKRMDTFPIQTRCGEYDRGAVDPVDFLGQVDFHDAPFARPTGQRATASR